MKIRGTAAQVLEKYLNLAKEAATSGDRVASENYYQHAEHYYRIVNADNEDKPKQQANGAADTDAVDPSNAPQPDVSGEGGNKGQDGGRGRRRGPRPDQNDQSGQNDKSGQNDRAGQSAQNEKSAQGAGNPEAGGGDNPKASQSGSENSKEPASPRRRARKEDPGDGKPEGDESKEQPVTA